MDNEENKNVEEVKEIEIKCDGDYCTVDPHKFHKCLEEFEDEEIIATFQRRGLIFGVYKNGKTRLLSENGEET